MNLAVQLVAFVELLRREQAALMAADLDALAAIVAEKNRLYEALRVETAPPSAAERTLIEEARRLNEENGRLIALHLRHTQNALNVLTAAASAATAYGPDGQPQSAVTPRHLGQA